MMSEEKQANKTLYKAVVVERKSRIQSGHNCWNKEWEHLEGQG